jgi:hypothetical protein
MKTRCRCALFMGALAAAISTLPNSWADSVERPPGAALKALTSGESQFARTRSQSASWTRIAHAMAIFAEPR